MPATVKVPTVFTAVDKFTGTVSKMANGVSRFVGRANNLFNRLTPTLSGVQRQLLEVASAGAIAGAIFGGIVFSGKAVMDYEKQLASFRTIVSDLSDKQFVKYRDQVKLVAKDTNNAASSIDIAAGFERIAGLNADFAKTADGLGQVTEAAITLSKASGDELFTSADNLVGIMNQFDLKANQANRTINVLAAGQAVGAANISQTSEALKVFGAVAKSSNINLEQSVGLIETLAQKQIMGSEAGTALRGTISRLQKAGMGYKSGVFQINDALEQARAKMDHFRTAKEKDRFVLKTFGLENLTAAKILMDNIGTYKNFTTSVTGTSEAQKAAAINTGTLSAKVDMLKNKWTTYITNNDKANEGLEKVKTTIGFVTDNLDGIVLVGISVLKFYVGWKVAMWAVNTAMAVQAFLTQTQNAELLLAVVRVVAYTGALILNKIASAGLTVATWAMTAAQWALNVALDANPIGLVILAIAAIVAAIMNWSSITAWFTKIWGKFTSWIGEAWNDVVKYFKDFSFKRFFLEIGESIFNFMLKPLMLVLDVASKLPGSFGRAAAGALASIKDFQATAHMVVENSGKPARPALPTPAEARATAQAQNGGMNGTLNVNFNDPNRIVKSYDTNGQLQPSVSVTSTW